jgi:hypothetical protein
MGRKNMSLRKILQAADNAADQAATLAQAAPLEAAVREIVQHDVVSLRRQHNETDAAARNQLSAEQLNVLSRRASDASLVEIDRVILELQHMQGMLRSEGERVCQDIAGYASLNHNFGR